MGSKAKFLSIGLVLMALALVGGGAGTPIGTQAAAPTSNQQPATSNQQSILVLQVYFRDHAERDRLAVELDATEAPTTDGYLTVIGDADVMRDLQAKGLRVEIDEESTKNINSPVFFGNTFYGGYRTVEEMEQFLDQKVAAYPGLVEKVDIGDTWCKTHPGQCTVPNSWNGFDMWVLHITNRSIPGPKPVFWYEAGIHSREIATPEVAMLYINWLLDGYANNAEARWLVDWHDIWVMPMFNTDGHHMVEAGGGSPYSQRKSGNRTYCTSWPPPGIGIDLNRNFPFLWNCCGGSSGAACSETYRGPSANSEQETQAVIAKISQLIPDQRGPNNTDPAPLDTTGLYQSMHSVANLNLYAWGWTTNPAPNSTDLRNIGMHMRATNAYPPGNNYQTCQPPSCLYSVDGDSMDWGYGERGIPSYTTEVSGGSFFPSYSTTVNTIWPENRGALIYQAKIARTPYLLTRGPDANSVATNPMTTTQGTPVNLSATINYVWTNNTYSQNVAAAEYYIDTPPWAGGVGIPMSGTFNSQTVPVNATINTSSIPPGTHVIFVRGRGVNDYGGFQSWGPMSATFLTILPGCAPGPDYLITPSTGAAIVPGTTQVPGSTCNSCTVNITLPFSYDFYGTMYSSVVASNKGNLQFTGNTSSGANTCLPTASISNAILAYWDDINTNIHDNMGIYTSVQGSAPNRIFTIEWRGGFESNDATVNFEVRLYEGQPKFEVIYGTTRGGGFSATVGVQEGTGSRFTQHSCDQTNAVPPGTKLTFDRRACEAGAGTDN